MKLLYTDKEFDKSKSTDKIPCKCYHCGNTFYKMKKYITYELKHKKGEIKFCSNKCKYNFRVTDENINCSNCDVKIVKKSYQIKRNVNNFCSLSCSASYNNKHKKYGTRRSKLELWIEERLTSLHPNLGIHYNRKNTIGSELDIFIPSLNLAIELNGIFHYEPIFGNDKLNQIKENDMYKSKACFDNQIDLCIIDTSFQKYVKPKTSKKYLDIILNIIKERMLTS